MSFLSKFLPVIGGVVGSVVPGIGTALGATIGGAAGGLLEGNEKQKKADKLNKQALQIATAKWNATAPLRDIALQRLQTTQRPDLTRVFRNPQNPFGDNRAAPMPLASQAVNASPAPPPATPPATPTGGWVGELMRRRQQQLGQSGAGLTARPVDNRRLL